MFNQRRNLCLLPSLPSRVSHTHHRPPTMIPVLRPCKRVVRFSRLSRHIFVVLPSSPDIRSAQEHDQPLQNWITHHRSSATRFKPDLIECEDVTSLWADVSATPARILEPTSLQRIVFDSLHRIAHPGFNAGLMLSERSYWGQGISKDVARWTQFCAACQKRRFMSPRKCHLNDCRHRINASAIFTSI